MFPFESNYLYLQLPHNHTHHVTRNVHVVQNTWNQNRDERFLDIQTSDIQDNEGYLYRFYIVFYP